MVDKEKVLVGLKSCADSTGALCRTCPYDFVHNENCMGDMARDALELLKKQPEQKFFVDSDGKMTPLPIQKHGHWMVVEENYDDEQHWQCSACGCEWYLEAGNPEENNMLYCPECGAKMDGEVKQDET